MHIARWVTTHGFALNVNTDLSYFNLIIACDGEQVTSMDDLLGHEVDIGEVEDRLAARFAEVFEMEMEFEVRDSQPNCNPACGSSESIKPGVERSEGFTLSPAPQVCFSDHLVFLVSWRLNFTDAYNRNDQKPRPEYAAAFIARLLLLHVPLMKQPAKKSFQV